MNINEYIQYDAIGLAELVKAKKVSPLELLEICKKLVQKLNPKINAVNHTFFEEAHHQLKDLDTNAEFYGVPFFLKDLGQHLSGIPTTAGSRFLKSYTPNFDSEIVKRYKKAGLVIVAKTNVPEFGLVGVTESELLGPCRNPWDLHLTSGGSSGGSASAVAARILPMASADDGGGSIRIPASACGLVGLKPSRGLMPMGPDKNESWLGLVSGHIVSRSVRDTAKMLDLTAGAMLGSPYSCVKKESYLQLSKSSIKGMKIGYSMASILGQATHKDCIKAVSQTLEICKNLGCEVIEKEPDLDKDSLRFAYLIIVACSTAGEVHRAEQLMGHKASTSDIELATYFLKNVGEKMQAPLLEWAIYQCRKASIKMGEFHQQFDFFCTPTMAYPPAEIGLMNMSFIEKIGAKLSPLIPGKTLTAALKQMAEKGLERTPNTEPFNMTGQPGISLPTFWNEANVPIGVQFIAALGEDQKLLQLGDKLEAELNWQKRIPDFVKQSLA